MALIHLWRSFKKSVSHALSGLGYAFREERNFQIEVVIGMITVMLTLFFPLSAVERSVMFLLIGTVLTLELFNTAFERLLDMLKPRIHPYVKVVKDMVAGAVLIGSLTALIIGLTILLPHIWALLKTW